MYSSESESNLRLYVLRKGAAIKVVNSKYISVKATANSIWINVFSPKAISATDLRAPRKIDGALDRGSV